MNFLCWLGIHEKIKEGRKIYCSRCEWEKILPRRAVINLAYIPWPGAKERFCKALIEEVEFLGEYSKVRFIEISPPEHTSYCSLFSRLRLNSDIEWND